MSDNDKQPSAGKEPADSPKRKRVGDETPNPLPDRPYAVEQPAGDDNQANPESDSSTD